MYHEVIFSLQLSTKPEAKEFTSFGSKFPNVGKHCLQNWSFVFLFFLNEYVCMLEVNCMYSTLFW